MHRLMALLDLAGITREVVGDPIQDQFDRVAPLERAGPNALVWVDAPDDDTLAILSRTPARIALVERTWGHAVLPKLHELPVTTFLVDAPRLTVARILRLIHPALDSSPPGVHPTAIVHAKAEIDPTASIGPYCLIGRCRIGASSVIGSHTIVGDGVEIGSRVIVREHCSIGGYGFGYARTEQGPWERIPHVGSVVIEDEVEIFPFANVDRGTLDATLIRRGTKIDHYVHVGHNVVIGEDSIITAGTVLCGSSRVGSRVWLGVGSIVRESTAVGDRATLGLGAVATSDVAPGDVVGGVPARSLRATQAPDRSSTAQPRK